ncbi:MAG: metal-dependent transcriptional regulator [Euryarchaeota archaeon]|nr:metal-dependent transcriptional regulator [Euryarchaeota archaeon]MBT4392315.1 metal-dependent transcriptional regulator [Euryarchaeota archaeon]MBT4802705.1 metal-dependent transcriptional regulator [Euryarchaeota archaeon]MBT5613795.1 metal-dependent transcriptional regulator [Euryarchaeota archaeon]MBT6683627.1 metal-dependent transcriptional regulator [Euryarchaeota archaeon]
MNNIIQLSEFEEMYLKRIFELHFAKPDQIVRTSQLAEIMKVSSASTTEMLIRLSKRELLTYLPYRGCRLTPQGFVNAARIKRRESLIEILLKDVIGYTGDINAAACKIEHAIDQDLELALDNMLGYPEMSPSGVKIPIMERKMEPIMNNLLPLNCLPINSIGKIELIVMNDSEKKTFEVMGIKQGSIIKNVEGKYRFNDDTLEISNSLSHKILVRVSSYSE